MSSSLTAASRPIAALFLVAGAVGCAAVPHRLDPATVASGRPTDVTSLIPQRQITIKWLASGYNMNGSLLGAIIASSANGGRKDAAEARALPLQAQTQDIDFQGRYAAALTDLVKDVRYLRLQRFTRRDDLRPTASASDVEGNHLLRVGTDYQLSPDSVVLQVSSGLGFFASGQPDRPAAVMRTFYRSEEVGSGEDDAALAVWAANGARLYRGALAEGAAENLKMTRMALEHLGGTDYAGPQVKVHALLVHGRGDFGVKLSAEDLVGTIVEETPRRLILRTEDAFYSIPKSAIESRELIGQSPGVAWRAPAIATPLAFLAPASPPMTAPQAAAQPAAPPAASPPAAPPAASPPAAPPAGQRPVAGGAVPASLVAPGARGPE